MIDLSKNIKIDFKRKYEKKLFVPTPFEELNRRLRGGMKTGEVGCIMAPSGEGKSLTLLSIAIAAARFFQFNQSDKLAYYFLLEMSADEVLERAIQTVYGYSSEELISKGSISVPSLPLVIVDQLDYRNSIDGITDFIRTNNFSPGLIVVDYAANLDEVLGQGWEAYTKVSKQLERLAQVFKTVVWTGSQVTVPMDFDREKSLYGEQHIAGGKALRNSMSLFMSLNRTREQREKHLATINPFKCRRGDNTPFDVFMNGDICRVADLSVSGNKEENVQVSNITQE